MKIWLVLLAPLPLLSAVRIPHERSGGRRDDAPGAAGPGPGWILRFGAAVALTGAAAVWALSGLPGPVSSGARTNVVLGAGLAALTVWWGLALRAGEGRRLRTALAVGLAGALSGAIPTLALVLSRAQWLHPGVAVRSLVLYALEVPLWALALLLWPPAVRRPPLRRLALKGVLLLATAGVAFWLLLIRPRGGAPGTLWARGAMASWAFVLFCVVAALLRGPRRGLRLPFWLLVAALGATWGGNLLVAAPELPASTVFVSGMVALALRMGAAEAVRTGSG